MLQVIVAIDRYQNENEVVVRNALPHPFRLSLLLARYGPGKDVKKLV